jgi:hypothetical protein
MRTTRQLHERATLAITPLAVLLAQAPTKTTPASPIPDVTPDLSKVPGGKGLQDAIDVFGTYALIAAVAGFLIGGAVWAVGGRVGHDHASQGGKVGMAVAAGVAFLIGAAKTIIDFAYSAGGA